MKAWQLPEAKAKLSTVIQKAEQVGPQRITVRGVPTAVVVSEAEFRRLAAPKPRFLDLMRRSPLVGLKLDLRRKQTRTRTVTLA